MKFANGLNNALDASVKFPRYKKPLPVRVVMYGAALKN